MDLTNVAVHCQTEGLAEQVLIKAASMGYRWSDDNVFTSYTLWRVHEKQTCYLVKIGVYGDLITCQRKGYKIISAEEFLNEPKTSSVEEIKKPTPEQ